MDVRVGIASACALLALVLQVVVAPNIALMGTMPNFIIAYVLVAAMLLPSSPSYIIAFCLGLLADLLGFGPVGALPLILLLCVFALEAAIEAFGNGTLFVSCLILVAFVILVHFLHTAFMVAMSSTYSAADAFMLVGIPAALYDCVLAVLIYVGMRRILTPTQSTISHIGPLTK